MTRTDAARRARPRSQRAGYLKVYARISPHTKAELVEASRRTGLSLSELIRRNLEARSGRLAETRGTE